MTRPGADGSHAPDGAIHRRVVLLGASNLTQGIATVLETAQAAWGRPLEVLAALGHGRSYGRASRVFGRELSGILQCGLWPELSRSAPAATAALVTDIGNDLLYEEPVERIAAWIEQCLDRLAVVQARTSVTLLPLGNLRRLSASRFRLLRTLLVPGCGLSLAEVTGRAHALDEEVRRLAVARGLRLIAQRLDWYGFDPIHIRFRRRGEAWREILSSWRDDEPPATARGSWSRSLYLRSRVPDCRRICGFEQRRLQPTARFDDGTTVAIY